MSDPTGSLEIVRAPKVEAPAPAPARPPFWRRRPWQIAGAAFLALLRQRMGHGRAWQATLPDWLTSLSARLGDLLPISPWCSETLALLSHDNVAPVTAVEQALGRSPMSPDQFPLSDTPS